MAEWISNNKWLEPEKTAMLMHRGRSCASQHKLVAGWQALELSVRVPAPSNACNHSHHSQSGERKLQGTPRFTCHSLGERVEQSKRSPIVACADTNQNWHRKIYTRPVASQMEGITINIYGNELRCHLGARRGFDVRSLERTDYSKA
jgi:hypothetical protein